MKKANSFAALAVLFAVAGSAQAWWYPYAPYPYYGYGVPYAAPAAGNSEQYNTWARSWADSQAAYLRPMQEMNQRARKEMDKAMQEMQARRNEAEARRAQMIKEMQERRSKSKAGASMGTKADKDSV
ncbi:MAG: hypothetical protein KDH88_00930 [Chromatiales bacterium]|nr:hypothetical protein [Chromatiales bacterium]